jgi:hypothetical protein
MVGAGGVPIHRVRHRHGVHVEGDLMSGAGGVLAPPEQTVHFAAEPGTTPFFEAWDARDAAEGGLPLGHVHLAIPSDVPDEWTVELPPERFASGRVVAADGSGVPGARIRISSAIHGRAFEDLYTVTSGDDGAFRAGGLGSGEYVLSASAPGHAAAEVVVRGGATGVAIRLGTGARATVRVVDADGAPVPQASVSVRPSDAAGGRDRLGGAEELLTDSEGRVTLPGLAAGVPHDLDVFVPVFGHEDGHFPAELRGWIPTDVEVRLERRLRVEGAVRLPDGRPFPGCEVTAVDDGGRGGEIVVQPGIAPGAFVLRDLRTGQRVRIRATAGDATSQEATVEAGRRDVTLVLDPGAWFTVRISDPQIESVSPFADERRLRMWLFPGGRSIPVAPNGESALGSLDARRRYTVVVGPTPTGRCAEVRDVAADGRTVEVALQPGLPIAGRVAVAEGRTIDRGAARIEATREDAVVATTGIDADDRFRFPGLPAGRWTLRAVVDGTAAPLATVEAEAGVADVLVTLPGR